MLGNALWTHSEELGRLFARKDELRGQSFGAIWTSTDTGASISEVEHLIDEKLRAISDITEETACLKEIKDVLDELNSVAHVFRQQIAVVKMMVDDVGMQKRNESRGKPYAPSSDPAARNSSKDMRISAAADTGRAAGPASKDGAPPAGGQDPSVPEHSLEDTEGMYKHMLTTLERRLGDIESLDAKAYRVYKDVSCRLAAPGHEESC